MLTFRRPTASLVGLGLRPTSLPLAARIQILPVAPPNGRLRTVSVRWLQAGRPNDIARASLMNYGVSGIRSKVKSGEEAADPVLEFSKRRPFWPLVFMVLIPTGIAFTVYVAYSGWGMIRQEFWNYVASHHTRSLYMWEDGREHSYWSFLISSMGAQFSEARRRWLLGNLPATFQVFGTDAQPYQAGPDTQELVASFLLGQAEDPDGRKLMLQHPDLRDMLMNAFYNTEDNVPPIMLQIVRTLCAKDRKFRKDFADSKYFLQLYYIIHSQHYREFGASDIAHEMLAIFLANDDHPLPDFESMETVLPAITALAFSFEQQKLPLIASKAFRACIEINPDVSAYWIGLGSSLQSMGEDVPAAICFATALDTRSRDLLPSFHLARTLADMGDHEGALETLEKGMEGLNLMAEYMPPDVLSNFVDLHMPAIKRLARLQMLCGRYEDAEATVDRWLKNTEMRDPDAFRMLGLVYMAQGKDDVAVDALENCLQLNGLYPEVSYDIAMLQMRMGDFESAALSADRTRQMGNLLLQTAISDQKPDVEKMQEAVRVVDAKAHLLEATARHRLAQQLEDDLEDESALEERQLAVTNFRAAFELDPLLREETSWNEEHEQFVLTPDPVPAEDRPYVREQLEWEREEAAFEEAEEYDEYEPAF